MTTETSLLAGEETLHHTMQNYHQVLRRRLIWIGVLLLAILASLILDFTLGPAGLSLETLWNTLLSPESVDAGTRVIVWDIRLPYALMALVVGLSLGLAGAEMQTILNNPLASPFTLGVSSAAAFGAALAIIRRGYSRHSRSVVNFCQCLCLCSVCRADAGCRDPLDSGLFGGRGAVRYRAGLHL